MRYGRRQVAAFLMLDRCIDGVPERQRQPDRVRGYCRLDLWRVAADRQLQDEIAGVPVTMIDNGMPVVIRRDVGVTGYECQRTRK